MWNTMFIWLAFVVGFCLAWYLRKIENDGLREMVVILRDLKGIYEKMSEIKKESLDSFDRFMKISNKLDAMQRRHIDALKKENTFLRSRGGKVQ